MTFSNILVISTPLFLTGIKTQINIAKQTEHDGTALPGLVCTYHPVETYRHSCSLRNPKGMNYLTCKCITDILECLRNLLAEEDS
jgi:hypothetical protein